MSLDVTRAKPVISWPKPDPILYGTLLGAAQLSATASVPGKFEYSPASGEVLPPGTHPLSVSFTPADTANFATTQAAVLLEVAKATPAAAPLRPGPISNGAHSGVTNFHPAAPLPGRFNYAPAAARVLTPESFDDMAPLPAQVRHMPPAPSNGAKYSALADTLPLESAGRRTATAAIARETRVYKGAVYEKGEDGQWHLQQK